MKVSADVDKQQNANAISMLKENMISSREAMKDQTAERIARNNAKRNGKKTD